MLFNSKIGRDFSRAFAAGHETGGGLLGNILTPLFAATAFAFGGAFSATLLAIPVAAAAGPLALALSLGAAFFCGGLTLWGCAKADMTSRTTDREFNGLRLAGSRKDIGMVVSTTLALKAITGEFNTLADLPPRHQRCVNRFIRDMTAATSRVAMLTKNADGTFTPVDEMPVIRNVIRADGNYADVTMARLKTKAVDGIAPTAGP